MDYWSFENHSITPLIQHSITLTILNTSIHLSKIIRQLSCFPYCRKRFRHHESNQQRRNHATDKSLDDW